MPEVSELDLPTFDYLDPTLVGARFHSVMNGLREQGWLAAVQPMGYVVLDRETVDLVLRAREARMPAMEILELQGITYRGSRRRWRSSPGGCVEGSVGGGT